VFSLDHLQSEAPFDMKKRHLLQLPNINDGAYLGIECGGTRSVAITSDAQFQMIDRFELPGANLRLVTDGDLLDFLARAHERVPSPVAIGLGMAGARSPSDVIRIQQLLVEVWPSVPIRVDHDLETALLAACQHAEPNDAPRVIVLSGTGSCCYGKNSVGQVAKVGGWGHFLGDRGSAYDLSHRALRALVLGVDHGKRMGALSRRLLASIGRSDPEDLISWIQSASKAEIAGLAPAVFAAAVEGDGSAIEVIRESGKTLAADAVACARKLLQRKPPQPLEFYFAGSVLLNQPTYARLVARAIRDKLPHASARLLPREGAWGAVSLAMQAVAVGSRPAAPAQSGVLMVPEGGAGLSTIPPSPSTAGITELSPTEQRNPRSLHLDVMPLEESVALMLEEESNVCGNLEVHSDKIVKIVKMIVRGFKAGGRLFYVGAGTSGRLGVLDASECPPTFRTPSEMVQGIIAGGNAALVAAVEGAEDDSAAGARSIVDRHVSARDVVIGIAASGRTPFVLAALVQAKKAGARTAFLCFNPHAKLDPKARPDVWVAVNLGAEVLTGSTRLKAGTATKILLNIFTTLSMVRIGKVMGNLMVDLNPSNAKLRARAIRIVADLTGVEPSQAETALCNANWVVKDAVLTLQRAPQS